MGIIRFLKEETPMANRNIENITAVIDYVEDHLTEKLDLDRIAEAVHYSKYHLHRMFADTVGLTVHDYIQRRRLTGGGQAARFFPTSLFWKSL